MAEDAGSLDRGRFRYFPVAPGRMEFAIEVRRALLSARPDVVAVVYVSKADALREALARPGMADLIDQTEGNPLPAGYDVRLKSLAAVESLALWWFSR